MDIVEKVSFISTKYEDYAFKKDICSLTLPRMVRNNLKHFPLTFNFDFFLENFKEYKSST